MLMPIAALLFVFVLCAVVFIDDYIERKRDDAIWKK